MSACLLAATLTSAGHAEVDPAAGLRAKFEAMRIQLGSNQFGRPLHLDSAESADGLTGNAYALIDHPFATVAGALHSPGDWCEILALHINTKYCRAAMKGQASVLNVSIGAKHDQPLEGAYRVKFDFRVAAQTPDYLQVRLDADQGPLSTRDYRIVMQAVAVEEGRTFIHLSYSYGFGAMGRVALQAYLHTIGRSKVGFTVAGMQANGKPRHIGGSRGVVERNTMRYYLAIEAFLGALATPPQARFEKRLNDWFAAAERYPRQLHEMERDEYLDMKRKERLRQQV